MRKDLALPRWARYAAAGVLLAVALTAGALSLALNVMHGLEAGLAAAIAFGLADIGKILLPVVAGMIGWSRQMRATAAICVAVSLWSAVNVYLDGAGRELLVKQHGAMVYAEAEKQITELEREAASLRSLAAAEAGKGGCRQNCRALTEQASRAATELGKARAARAELRPVEISGLAAMVAIAWGEKPEGVARGIAAIKALLFLALIEVLVWLSVPAMVLIEAEFVQDMSPFLLLWAPCAGCVISRRLTRRASLCECSRAASSMSQLTFAGIRQPMALMSPRNGVRRMGVSSTFPWALPIIS